MKKGFLPQSSNDRSFTFLHVLMKRIKAIHRRLSKWAKENHAWFWFGAVIWVALVALLWYAIFSLKIINLPSIETGQTVGYFIGGIGVATIAMVTAGRRTHALMQQVINDQTRVINENFTKSIELLGHDAQAVRHGGLFSLQRMMDDERLYPAIVQIVTSYVRHKSQYYFNETVKKYSGNKDQATISEDQATISKNQAIISLDKKPMEIDVEAALSVLKNRNDSDIAQFEEFEIRRQRKHSPEEYLFDLSNSKLFNADLSHTRLARFNLSDCLIRNCILFDSSLVESNLAATDFTGTDLSATDFTDAIMTTAMPDANRPGTNFSGADLTGAIGLTQKQIDVATGDAKTKLPDGLQRPSSWKNNSQVPPAQDGQ